MFFIKIKVAKYKRNRLRKNIKQKFIDTDLFISYWRFNLTYLSEWAKPNGERYVKFTKWPPYFCNYGMEELKINDCNSYGHRLLKLEKCYILG